MCNLLKLNHKNMETLNKPPTNNKIESVIKSSKKKKAKNRIR